MFRFTIRDVLWLTVVAGLSCALWLEHTRYRRCPPRYFRYPRTPNRSLTTQRLEAANAKWRGF